MKKPGSIQPIRNHPASRVSAKVTLLPEKDDIVRRLTTENGVLRDKLSRKNDQQRRLREEILTEIEIWTDLLASGKKVSFDHIKRRLSQLNGSLLYPGMPMDEMVER